MLRSRRDSSSNPHKNYKVSSRFCQGFSKVLQISSAYGIIRPYDIWGSYLISDPYGKFFRGPLTKNSARVIIKHLRSQGPIRI
jgi:hypothetical protein